MSQTPRCGLPTIVIEDAPKKTTIRALSGVADKSARQEIEHTAKEEFRKLFAHASRSQVKSLISMLGNLNQANMRYHIFLLQLKPDSLLRFKVDDASRGVERTYEVNKETVQLGMETFEKGLRNVYYYYKFRGTKTSKRTGVKEADNLADLQAFRNYHRHLWVPTDSALYNWIMKEDLLPNSDSFMNDVRARLQGLIENGTNSQYFGFKGGKPILHILNSTIQTLFHILFEANTNLKVKIPKDKTIPRELKQPQYYTTTAIQNELYAKPVVHPIVWDAKTNKAVVADQLNNEPKYTVAIALQQKIQLRRQHKQKLYHDFDPNRIFMKDFMTVTSLSTISGDFMRLLYEQYKFVQISSKPIQQGEDVSQRYISFEEFRGDNQFGQQLFNLQQVVDAKYKRLKASADAVNPTTIRNTYRVQLSNILEVGGLQPVVSSGGF